MAHILLNTDFYTAHQQRSATIALLQRQNCIDLLEELEVEGRNSLIKLIDSGQRLKLAVPDIALRNQLNQLLGGFEGLRFFYEAGGVLFSVQCSVGSRSRSFQSQSQ